jgi:hypothetical protein
VTQGDFTFLHIRLPTALQARRGLLNSISILVSHLEGLLSITSVCPLAKVLLRA